MGDAFQEPLWRQVLSGAQMLLREGEKYLGEGA